MYSLANATVMRNYGFKDEAIVAAHDTVALGYWGGAGQKLGENMIFEFRSTNYTLQGLVGLYQPPINFTDTGGYKSPSFIQHLRDTNQTGSVSYGYTAGAQYRMFTRSYLLLISMED
jgi:hypothetical protein